MKTMDQSAGLFALHHVLTLHVLPRLPAKELGRLACTCKAARDLVLQLNLSEWQRIARDILPPRHPVLHTKCHQVDEIRAALAAFGPSEACLRKGQFTCQKRLDDVLGEPQFSPDGHVLAALVHHEGADNPPSSLERIVEDEQADCCLTAIFEDGTQKLLLWTVVSGERHTDWRWSRDGRTLVMASVPMLSQKLSLQTVRVETGKSNSRIIPLDLEDTELLDSIKLSADGEQQIAADGPVAAPG
ncbi:hypothetical protein WJX73_009853 [Symbiochloris irregularis]|uniref:F-box domain-containing protein n=1 Tax=Symbiochloris irregularis TaxID=706552 RepID=A0AAW1PSX7_9CHLO